MPTNYNKDYINKYDWGFYSHTEKLLKQCIKDFLNNNSFAQTISSRMELETSTQSYDWIDHIIFPENIISRKGLGWKNHDHHRWDAQLLVSIKAPRVIIWKIYREPKDLKDSTSVLYRLSIRLLALENIQLNGKFKYVTQP